MTHPLTPREKVARIVDPEAFDHPTVHPQHLVARRSVSFSKADAILTALASGSGDHSGGVTDMIGSGDHAELARMCERLRDTFIRFNMGYREEPLRNPDGPAAADAIEALIAENAAMRASDERTGELLAESNHREARAAVRATEAERKLAEAVGHIEAARDSAEYQYLIAKTEREGDRWRKVRDFHITFLSKEAERG